MGLLSKFKNIFVEEYEEDEVEIPEKKIEKKEREFEPFVRQPKPEPKQFKLEPEVKPVNIEKPVSVPKVEPQIESVVKEEETIKIETPPKKEEKFIFPVYFDEKDFETEKRESKPVPKIEKPVEMQPRRDVKIEKREVKTESSYKEAYNKKAQVREERHVFKPTPIISPVYGILDKNYYKEDIVVSTPTSRTHYSSTSKTITIDDVRNKAFGSLEDELADTILTDEKENIKPEADNDDIINEKDFETAVEEDKKRDIGKDTLKSDIEALLNNDEFTSMLNFKKTKIEDIPEKKEVKEEKKEQDDDSLIDDIVRLATDDDFDDTKKSKEVKIHTESDNSYEEANDLADNDLFSLIDSMYDKEDK